MNHQINILDLVLQDLMRRKGDKQLRFVQIGAHDGKHLDPLWPYVRRFHWRGLLVEPQPDVFKQLVANYEDCCPRVLFRNVAIGPANGTIDMNVFAGQSLHEHSTMLASYFPKAITNNTHGYATEATTITVPCITLAELFERHDITSLDLLQIDAEGYDHEILKQLRDLTIRPTAINFESAFYGQGELNECYTMLVQMGYKLARTSIDTIAFIQGDEFVRCGYEGREIQ